jgi:hypothetical protein
MSAYLAAVHESGCGPIAETTGVQPTAIAENPQRSGERVIPAISKCKSPSRFRARAFFCNRRLACYGSNVPRELVPSISAFPLPW